MKNRKNSKYGHETSAPKGLNIKVLFTVLVFVVLILLAVIAIPRYIASQDIKSQYPFLKDNSYKNKTVMYSVTGNLWQVTEKKLEFKFNASAPQDNGYYCDGKKPNIILYKDYSIPFITKGPYVLILECNDYYWVSRASMIKTGPLYGPFDKNITASK